MGTLVENTGFMDPTSPLGWDFRVKVTVSEKAGAGRDMSTHLCQVPKCLNEEVDI